MLICTTMRSESTFVPPVTAQRSPPLSRMTGADSPVMADSSTEAMPSTTSPSPGMSMPATTTTRSPLRSVEADTSTSRPSTSLCALRVLSHLAKRRRLRLAAALRHRLGEVREHHGEPEPGAHEPGEPQRGGASGR